MRPNTLPDRFRRSQRRLPLLLLVLLALALLALDAHAQDNRPLQEGETPLSEFYEPGVIHIKFADAISVRIRDGAPRAVNTEAKAAVPDERR